MRSARFVLLCVAALAGCSGVPSLPGLSAYKIDVQQGNVVTQDMVAKLKPGMTKAQVRFALGTPMIVDAFHSDRWDYVYRLEKGGKLLEHRKITAVFDDDKLTRIEGDVVPMAAGADAAPAAAGAQKPATADAPEKAQQEAQQQKGFFGRMLEKIGF
ncbi:MAG TPA: outer membrane protein assembly factor BamE [Burkholderiales bacterium]|nr:outer membrane protein assembly factor BamE [Burkholderiales bacterium]